MSSPTQNYPLPEFPEAGKVGDSPRQLGQYLLLEQLGQGGMGRVYKAFHSRLKKLVALKTLRLDRIQSPGLVARLEREMEAVGRLDHPHVIRATDAGVDQGVPFLVMEFVEGMDLAKLVNLSGPLPVSDACALLQQAARGLQYIHEHGLVHRDIKPSNLLLSRSGQLKILDLGLARLQKISSTEEELTSTGQVLGTLDYIAPEQWQDAHRVDIRADLYSLGCTFYKLLTGKVPFSEPRYDSNWKKMQGHANEPVTPVREFRRDVPPGVQDILDRLLAKKPEDRFAVPEELAQALEPFLSGNDLTKFVPDPENHINKDKVSSSPETPFLYSKTTDSFFQEKDRIPSRKESKTSLLVKVAGRRRIWGMLFGGFLLIGGTWKYFGSVREPEKNLLSPLPLLPPPSRLDWPDKFPDILRIRPQEMVIDLISPQKQPAGDPGDSVCQKIHFPGVDPQKLLTWQPIWCRRLAGSGVYQPLQDCLALTSRDLSVHSQCKYTLLALDDDRARRWFEYTAQIQEPSMTQKAKAISGIFFGGQPWEGKGNRAYFVGIEFGLHGGGPPQGNQLHVGFSLWKAGISNDSVYPWTDLEPWPPFSIQMEEQKTHYLVRVRTGPEKIRIFVNDRLVLDRNQHLDPRGPLGIWAQDCTARFGKITLTAKEEEN